MEDCCDLLEKSYFCSIANNLIASLAKFMPVVICLKNRTFAVSQTTLSSLIYRVFRLWFAWKIVLLQYRKQHLNVVQLIPNGCDLLEKSYFCSIANNRKTDLTTSNQLWFAWKIVLLQYRKQPTGFSPPRSSCCDLLEKSYFCSIANNPYKANTSLWALWFAWKIVLLQYRKQQLSFSPPFQIGCDLLEKSYFCSIANNCKKKMRTLVMLWFAWKIVLLQYRKQQGVQAHNAGIVVICLKNRTFAVSQTTSQPLLRLPIQLWFAWKIVLLQYRKQHQRPYTYGHLVVICLKNRTFAVSQTTRWTPNGSLHPLWFAWKIVLLQYRKQPTWVILTMTIRCDLLEKSYFCSIANNLFSAFPTRQHVVICLKNRTFAVSQTTYLDRKMDREVLWFAWKIVLLQYRKQQCWCYVTHHPSCDLLEKSYFCSIANNRDSGSYYRSLLWFAWKIVLLQYRKQHMVVNIQVDGRCDLLEKSYFCSIANNNIIENNSSIVVVICLKNRTFAVSQTT